LIPNNEGSMWIIAMRDDLAPSGSRAASRTKGYSRNLGDPIRAIGKVADGGAGRRKTGALRRAAIGSRTGS
jgi:hypothetical protein